MHDFAASYLRAKAPLLRPATLDAYDRAYRLRIAPELGHRPLGALTREHLELWLGALLSSDPHRRSIEHAVETLRAMLSTAVEWDRIEINPAAKLRLPAVVEQRTPQRVLTREQLKRLYAACTSLQLETLFRTAAEAGLRRAELIGLRWCDVLLDARRMVVRETIWQGPGGLRVTQTPKGKRSRRVAITRTLAAQLAELRGLPGQTNDEDYVWPGASGGPMGKDSPAQALVRTLRRANLIEGSGKPMVTLHGLRHTSASIGLTEGVPLLLVSRQLGHARVDTTARVYAHLLDDSQLDGFADAHETRARP